MSLYVIVPQKSCDHVSSTHTVFISTLQFICTEVSRGEKFISGTLVYVGRKYNLTFFFFFLMIQKLPVVLSIVLKWF